MDSSLFGLAVWELRSLRKSQARDREAARKDAQAKAGRAPD